MNKQRYQEIRRVFLEVRELPRGARRAFMDRVCAADPDLRRALEALLTEDEHPTSIFDHLVLTRLPLKGTQTDEHLETKPGTDGQ